MRPEDELHPQQPVRILIIDDEADAGEILTLRLTRQEMQAHYVNSGSAGILYLQSTPVDIVLLDVKMPDMDGLQVLEGLKVIQPDVGIIMISGHADLDSAAKGLELGASHYMLKPIDFEILLHKIEDVQKHRYLASGTL